MDITSIQNLIKKEAREEAERVFNEKLKHGEFSNFETQKHEHNNIDSLRINQSNIIPGFAASGSITMATDGTRYRLGLTFNPVTVLIYGNLIRRNAVFTVTAANATADAVYTTGGKSFQVLTTIAGGTTLTTAGDGTGLTSGTLTKSSGTGDATITFSSVSTSIVIRTHVVGNSNLGKGYYFQPGTDETVIPGQTLNVIQSGSYFMGSSITPDASNPLFRAAITEGHLAQVTHPTSLLDDNICGQMTIPNLSTKALWSDLTSKGFGNGFVYVDVDLAPGWEFNVNFFVN